MAERIVSPGVFTRENDLSYLPQGIAQIGAAFIGPTLKGPAFRPTIVTSQEDFSTQFGETTPDYYTPYAVQGYLSKASRATIVRVLGLTGYDSTVTQGFALYLTSASVEKMVGYIHPTVAGITISGSLNGSASPISFTLKINTPSGSNATETIPGLSIDPTSANYFGKILTVDPKGPKNGYAYARFPSAASFASGSLGGASGSVITLKQMNTEVSLAGTTYGVYKNAVTPMISSQLFGSTRYDLFRFYTLSDGTDSNTDVKITIRDITPNSKGSGFGTFVVDVRALDNNDGGTYAYKETFKVSLDPSDPQYIAKVIGTSHWMNGYMEGDWPNNSNYIYVDVVDSIASIPAEALPYGFEALATPANVVGVPAPNYILSRVTTPVGSTVAELSENIIYGFDFTGLTTVVTPTTPRDWTNDTNMSYLQATPSGSVNGSRDTLIVGYFASGSEEVPAGGIDPGFYLDGSNINATDATYFTTHPLEGIYRRFSVPFQGGFNGQNPAAIRSTGANITDDNTMGFDLSNSNTDGALAYLDAIESISNPDAWDINMLVLPGVIYSLHSYVAQKAMNLCETRGDAFYIMDPDTLTATVGGVVNNVRALDTNYTAVYHPWVKIRDLNTSAGIWVPPSVVMVGVYAFSDSVSHEWFAPAGLNRGGITDATQVRAQLKQADRDSLYEGRVNPIAQFPGQGIVAWGQKTLQQRASALDRVNVRRLLIAVKKFIASSSRYLVFEQNVDSTRQRFLAIVNPYLSSVQEQNGLYAFKVVMDETNNTADVIDRNMLVGDLYLKPTKTAEYIVLNFNVLPTGATFPS